jgi:hypothetical protein
MKHGRTRLVVLVLLAALAAGGCSDDLTCPEIQPEDTEPYISARVEQGTDGRAEWAHADVSCTADPVPSLLIAFITGREVSTPAPYDGAGLRVTLDDDVVLWQPGTVCSLGVTTNYGYATASEIVPEAVSVVAPETISLGDSLALSWNSASGADYYEVLAELNHVGAPTRGRQSVTLSATTRDTRVVFLPEDIEFEGVISGVVEATSGPFPESGMEGNVSGDGWGFFTLHQTGPESEFSVAVQLGR